MHVLPYLNDNYIKIRPEFNLILTIASLNPLTRALFNLALPKRDKPLLVGLNMASQAKIEEVMFRLT